MKPFSTIFAAIFLAASIQSQAAPLRLGFFASLDPAHPFWMSVRDFEEAAGEDLALKSDWYYANSDHFRAREQIQRAATEPPRMNAAVIPDFNGRGPELLAVATDLKVPVITFAGFDISPEFRPRKDNAAWIGAIAIDEERVGYSTATQLIAEADRLKLVAPDGKIHVVGISGEVKSVLARDRLKGLQRAIDESSGHAILEQVVSTDDWSQNQGRTKAIGLFKRYPLTTVVWSANDAIALGVLDAVQSTGRRPGLDVLTCGVDWIPAALDAVRNGTMLCSAGGLGFQGGWAAVLLYDYLHGKDFVSDTGVVITIPHALATRDNVAKIANLGDWRKIDFSRFSKMLNPKRKRYDFSIDALLKASQ